MSVLERVPVLFCGVAIGVGAYSCSFADWRCYVMPLFETETSVRLRAIGVRLQTLENCVVQRKLGATERRKLWKWLEKLQGTAPLEHMRDILSLLST